MKFLIIITLLYDYNFNNFKKQLFSYISISILNIRYSLIFFIRFHFPHGKPPPTISTERTLRDILSAFEVFPNNQATKDELGRILKICDMPFYWRMPVMHCCRPQNNSNLIERQRFIEFWKQ